MLKRILTKKNVLRSLVNAIIFTSCFFLVKLLFYKFGWDDEESLNAFGFVFYFLSIFLGFFILDGRDYTWKDLLKFKNLNKK
ncbi:hypothetical protein [Chryseobacterium endophyticum]|uniref:Gliding motility protein GldL n=1 Tax=Chryseobacterium endophyticum TaxID=1854762 RepID=A0AAU6WR71_9FLAO|nr:hypothetical protein [uncultured Chryseobacterium sp.]